MSHFRLPGCASEPRNRIAVRSLVVPLLGTVSFECLPARPSHRDVSTRRIRFGAKAQIPSCRQADG
jgi:hypothetical protein